MTGVTLFFSGLGLGLEVAFDLLGVTRGADQFCSFPLGQSVVVMQPVYYYFGHFFFFSP